MNYQRMYTIILGPHVSEKTTIMGDRDNQYAFKVAVDATKAELKEAVEKLFKVAVEDVQTLNVKGKRKKSPKGQFRRRPNWKKAYVKLGQGHEIDFAELG